MTQDQQHVPASDGLLGLISPGMVDDCIERVARKTHVCETHGIWESRMARKEEVPGWVKQTWPACSQTINPGDHYVECKSEARAFESGSRYCSGCVSTGIPLGASNG